MTCYKGDLAVRCVFFVRSNYFVCTTKLYLKHTAIKGLLFMHVP